MPRKKLTTQPSSPGTSAGKAAASAYPATLVDVAKLAGVVAMTASRAINNSGYVSEDVRKRVLAAARKLRYRPNMLARRLAGQSLKAIGILLPDIANPFSSELVAGMSEVLDAAGFNAFVVTANHSVDQEKNRLQALIDHQVDGILVATRGTQLGDESIAAVARQGIPIVTIGRPVECPWIDCVTADHFRGSYEAVSHLTGLGHKRIAFIGSAQKDAYALRRFQGYAAALAEARIPQRDEYIVGPQGGPAFATQEDGYAGMMRLAKLKRPPTAIFARNDFAAIGALHAAHSLGLSVPDDVAVVGFDNIPLSAFSNPPLTTVSQPIAEQGRQAAHFLLDRIERGMSIARRSLCLECHLVIRQSTVPQPSTH